MIRLSSVRAGAVLKQRWGHPLIYREDALLEGQRVQN
jgi:hypothetical protein